MRERDRNRMKEREKEREREIVNYFSSILCSQKIRRRTTIVCLGKQGTKKPDNDSTTITLR